MHFRPPPKAETTYQNGFKSKLTSDDFSHGAPIYVMRSRVSRAGKDLAQPPSPMNVATGVGVSKRGHERTRCWLVTETGRNPAQSPDSPGSLLSTRAPSEFPDNQNIDKTLPALAHQLGSIFATTKFQQNLEILKSVFIRVDVSNWKTMVFDFPVSGQGCLSMCFVHVECFVPFTSFTPHKCSRNIQPRSPASSPPERSQMATVFWSLEAG